VTVNAAGISSFNRISSRLEIPVGFSNG